MTSGTETVIEHHQALAAGTGSSVEAAQSPAAVAPRAHQPRQAEQREMARRETALAALPETRRRMLDLLKREGSAGTDAIACAVGITPSGARQHLSALERDGLIAHRLDRAGPGRPRHRYELTAAGDTLFPRHYGALTTELLGYLEDEDPALLARIFDRRGGRRLAGARARLAGLRFAEQVAVVAAILDEDGYLADFAERDDGSFVITEHNCAVLAVAQRYAHACRSELDFLRAALPEAEVTRIAHRLNGAHVCAYEVRKRVEVRGER